MSLWIVIWLKKWGNINIRNNLYNSHFTLLKGFQCKNKEAFMAYVTIKVFRSYMPVVLFKFKPRVLKGRQLWNVFFRLNKYSKVYLVLSCHIIVQTDKQSIGKVIDFVQGGKIEELNATLVLEITSNFLITNWDSLQKFIF